MQEKIRQQIEVLAEEEYRVFSSGLLPGTRYVLGVRLPLLRKLSKQLAQSDWREYLQTAREDSFEEIMLQGMVIGCVNCSVEERLLHMQNFVPKIDNWSVCDSFCAGLKFTKEAQEQIWGFINPYLKSEQEFHIRFAVVMLLFYYIYETHIDKVLDSMDKVRHDGYYVKMAVAWAISICYVRFPERTLGYLNQNSLDDFTYNKALQKITESLKVDKETKKKIRAMKRKP
ncbi:DNA alkylation repair protein [Oscillibacter sp.]|uniref:DNA alkylation repair protein n=1 Tax=Oscillibacter sp. TaxID=1945593 RepID=UPI0028A05741|nr:DNA alkylation repair protein [Oscillibacter sp.]